MMMQSLSSKKVKQLIRGRELSWVAPEATAVDAARMMHERNVGALAVLRNDRLVGILSERDIVQRCVGLGDAPGETSVSKIMTPAVITIDKNMSIGVGILLMIENQIRHLPVMAHNRVLGMISIRQLVEEYRKGVESNLIRVV